MQASPAASPRFPPPGAGPASAGPGEPLPEQRRPGSLPPKPIKRQEPAEHRLGHQRRRTSPRRAPREVFTRIPRPGGQRSEGRAEAAGTAAPGCRLPPAPLCSPTRLARPRGPGLGSAGMGTADKAQAAGTPAPVEEMCSFGPSFRSGGNRQLDAQRAQEHASDQAAPEEGGGARVPRPSRVGASQVLTRSGEAGGGQGSLPSIAKSPGRQAALPSAPRGAPPPHPRSGALTAKSSQRKRALPAPREEPARPPAAQHKPQRRLFAGAAGRSALPLGSASTWDSASPSSRCKKYLVWSRVRNGIMLSQKLTERNQTLLFTRLGGDRILH